MGRGRKDLRLLGLVASIDPDRDGVEDSVLAARGAGIRVAPWRSKDSRGIHIYISRIRILAIYILYSILYYIFTVSRYSIYTVYIALAYICDMSNMCTKVMITGDYLKTAIAIAKNVQILQPQDDEAPEVDPRDDIHILHSYIYISYISQILVYTSRYIRSIYMCG